MGKKINKNINTLANKITLFRILLTPVIIIALLEHKTKWVLILLALSIASDSLDGFAARLKGEKTKLGTFLDPMADKILLISLYLTLTKLDLIEIWVFVVIFSRDILIILGWVIIYILTGATSVTPRPLGKATTVLQMGTAFSCILSIPNFWHIPLVWIMIAVTVISSIDYIIVGEKRLGEWG